MIDKSYQSHDWVDSPLTEEVNSQRLERIYKKLLWLEKYLEIFKEELKK